MSPSRTASAVLACALTACARPQTALKLAVITPLTGELGADGQGLLRSVQMAVEDARAEGGLSRPIEVVSFDDRNSPPEAADAAVRAASDPDVFAVIGPMTSGCAIAAARALAVTPLPMITPSATAEELTRQQERPQWPGARVVFRLPPSDGVQGEFDADYAVRRLNLKRVMVIQDGTPYGLGLADSFRRGFESRGGEVVEFTGLARGGDDFGPEAAKIAGASPEAVFFGGVYVEGGKLLKQARAAGFKGVFMSGDGAESPDFFKYAGDAADGAYLSMGGVPPETSPNGLEFQARYAKRWSGALPRTFDHYAYEAANLALWSLDKSGGDRAAAIEAIRREPHETKMGVFIFDSKGDSLKSLITMMKADARNRRFDPAY